MATVNSDVLILATLAHVLDRLKSIDTRLIDIEDSVVVDDLPEAEVDIEDDNAAALADQLLDAADEIEEMEIVPDFVDVAESLRQIAAQLEAAE